MNQQSTNKTPSYLTSYTALLAYAGMIYFTLAISSILLTRNHFYATIWPANAILLIFILRSPAQYAWQYFAVGITANIAANYYTGSAPLLTLGYALSNGIELLIPILFIPRYQNHPVTLSNIGPETYKIALTVIIGCTFSSLFAALWTTSIWKMEYALATFSWFASDMIAMMAILPLGLTISKAHYQRFINQNNMIEYLTVSIIACTITWTSFASLNVRHIIILIPLLYSAFRFGLFATEILCLIVTSVYVAGLIGLNPLPFPQQLLSPDEISYRILLMAITLLPAIIISILLEQQTDYEKMLSDNEQRWKFALESGHQGVLDWDIGNHRIYYSTTWKKMFGYQDDEVADTVEAWQARIHPDDLKNVNELLQSHLNGKTDEFHSEHRLRCRNNYYKWVMLRGKVIEYGKFKKPLRLIGTYTDIDALKQSEADMEKLSQRLQLAIDAGKIGIFNLDIPTNTLSWDERMLELYDTTPAEFTHHFDAWEKRLHPDDKQQTLKTFRLAIENKKAFDTEFRIINKYGTVRWVRATAQVLFDQQGQAISILGMNWDITREKNLLHDLEMEKEHLNNLQTELKHQATHDVLTGLINRREIERKIQRLIGDTRTVKHENSLLLIDLDNFKIVNDTAGHAAGDELLRRVADLLNKAVRTTDTVARLGGDEFAIILPECAPGEAAIIANNVIDKIKSYQFHWNQHTYEIGASIGLISFKPNTTSLESLLSHADIACYAAKNEGGNRVSIYEESNDTAQQYLAEIQMLPKIKTAISMNAFQLHAQLIQPIKEESPLNPYYELLLRMVDDTGHVIPPAVFIKVAERQHQIIDVDTWVMKHILKDRAEDMLRHTHLQLSMNLSSTSINSYAFHKTLKKLLSETIFDTKRIGFEIKESAFLNDPESALAFLKLITDFGCFVGLDSFGKGLSTFQYLKNIPDLYIKIDRGFIRNMSKNVVDQAIVDSINRIAHKLGAKTIAEFVETTETLEVAKDLGIDYAQGFAIGTAVPLGKILAPTQEDLIGAD